MDSYEKERAEIDNTLLELVRAAHTENKFNPFSRKAGDKAWRYFTKNYRKGSEKWDAAWATVRSEG